MFGRLYSQNYAAGIRGHPKNPGIENLNSKKSFDHPRQVRLLEIQGPRGGGGRVLPYISHIGVCVPPSSGMVLAPFWSENGYTLCAFGLKSGIVFEGTTECMNVFIVSIPNE